MHSPATSPPGRGRPRQARRRRRCRRHVRPAPPLDDATRGGAAPSASRRAPIEVEHVSGAARVVDGDTLVIGDTRVRLLGIDAPEMAQSCTAAGGGGGGTYACGVAAKEALDAKIDPSRRGRSPPCRARPARQPGGAPPRAACAPPRG